MTVAVVIVAAGRGRRLGGEIPKQYLTLGETCSLRRVLDIFLAVDGVDRIVTVIHDDDRPLYAAAVRGLTDPRVAPPVPGGSTRARSVRCGLEELERDRPDIVLIHDAARPFLPQDVILRVIGACATSDGACAALPVVDALWRCEGNRAESSVPRDGLWRAQTPQGFGFAKLLAAHRAHDGSGADDVAVAREAGLSVALVPGFEQNYKITTAADLVRARSDAQLLEAAQRRGGDAGETDGRRDKIVRMPAG